MSQRATRTKLPAQVQSKENAAPSINGSVSGWQLPELSKAFVSASPTVAAAAKSQYAEISNGIPQPGTKLAEQATIIEDTLARFGAPANIQQVHVGPTITQFALALAPKVGVSKVEKLVDNLALALADKSVRLEFPVLGRPLVGIQIASPRRTTVGLGQVLAASEFNQEAGALKVALGEDVTGQPVSFDLAKMPHLLIAGSTGSGKSVCLNGLIASLLAQYTPDELQFIMIDPKRVELTNFNGIPHLAYPVITQLTATPKVSLEQPAISTGLDNNIGTPEVDSTTDTARQKARNKQTQNLTKLPQETVAAPTPDTAVGGVGVMEALAWTVAEMERRYALLARYGFRHIQGFNQAVLEQPGASRNSNAVTGRKLPPDATRLPYLVVIIDELAELMLTAPQATESFIVRLAQKARAVGIHLVLATQRPSVDVVTGLIKANVPGRIAFAVRSQVDSRVILDVTGAEKLLGKGDMLFLAQDAPNPVRLQGVFVSDRELEKLVAFWQAQAPGLLELHTRMSGGAAEAKSLSIPGELPLQTTLPGMPDTSRTKAVRNNSRGWDRTMPSLVLLTPPPPPAHPALSPARPQPEATQAANDPAKEKEKEKEKTQLILRIAELEAVLATRDKELAELRQQLTELELAKTTKRNGQQPGKLAAANTTPAHLKLDKMEVGTAVFAAQTGLELPQLPVPVPPSTETETSPAVPTKLRTTKQARNNLAGSSLPITQEAVSVKAQSQKAKAPVTVANELALPKGTPPLAPTGNGAAKAPAQEQQQSDLRTVLFSPEQKRLDALLQTVKKFRKDQKAVVKLLLENPERNFSLTEMAAKTGYSEATLQKHFPTTPSLVVRLAATATATATTGETSRGRGNGKLSSTGQANYRANLKNYATRNFPGLDSQIVLAKLLELLA